MSSEITARLWSWSVHTGDSLFAEAASEIERLHGLITDWADACDRWGSEGLDITEQRIEETGRALRKAVGR